MGAELPRFQSLRRGAYQTSTHYTETTTQHSGQTTTVGLSQSKVALLNTLNETERRKIRRNFKVKNGTETNYPAKSPYMNNGKQGGFSTVNPTVASSRPMDTVTDSQSQSIPMGERSGDIKAANQDSQIYLKTKKIKKAKGRSRSPFSQSPRNEVPVAKKKKVPFGHATERDLKAIANIDFQTNEE